MKYRSTKTYGHETGLSVCFRQWRSETHCQLMHGYALAVELEFGADELDRNNWVIDFGSMGIIKKHLVTMFDHKTIVALDDPQLQMYWAMEAAGIAQLVFVENTGCEAFAEQVANMAHTWLHITGQASRVKLMRVTVREHGANSATVYPDLPYDKDAEEAYKDAQLSFYPQK